MGIAGRFMTAFGLLPALLAVAVPSAGAGANGARDTARARIAEQRAAIEAEFVGRQAQCRTRFAVNDCLDEARRARLQALRPLRDEERRLDDADRRRRAMARQQVLAEKAAQHAAAASAAAAGAGVPAAAASAAGEAASAARPATVVRPKESKVQKAPSRTRVELATPAGGSARPTDPAERQRRETESRARFAARQRAIAEHRAAVEQRNAERARAGKVSRPLPVPAAAASAGSAASATPKAPAGPAPAAASAAGR